MTSANSTNPSPIEEVQMDADLELDLFGSMDSPEITSADLESVSSTATPLPSSTQPSTTDSKRFVDDMNDPSLIGKYAPSRLVKTDKMLDLEAQKREKLAKREIALKGGVKGTSGEKPMTTSGAQKRKRSITPEAEGAAETKKVRVGGEAGEIAKGKDALKEGEKEEIAAVKPDAKNPAADVADKKQTLPTPMHSSKQKRKRGADSDDGEQKETKRALTDSTAAEIAQQHQHPSLEDLAQQGKRRDSVTEAATATVDGSGKRVSKEGEGEQHLAPAKKSDEGGKRDPNDLTIYPEDDEMTRMLKEELARQCCNIPEDDDSEPEDPRVEQVLAPLNEAEKLRLACDFEKREKKGLQLPDLAKLTTAVGIMLKSRKKKRAIAAANKPVKSSPLAGEGVSAESGNEAKGQGVEGGERKKLKPKGKLGATSANHTTAHTSPPAPSNNTTHASPPPPATTTVLSPYTVEPTDWAAFTLPILKNNCRERGLGVTGNKSVLVQRLEEYEKAVREGRTPETGGGKGGKGKGKRRG